MHGLFEFALRREWCDKNPIKRINRTPQSRRKGNPATETFRNKAANQNRSTRKPRICRCCRAFGLCGNSPEGSSQTHLARHRHRRKDNYHPLAVLEDRRRPSSGNPSRLKSASNYPQIRKHFPYMPDRLATPLAQNPRQLGLSRPLGSGCSAPHLRKLPRKILRKPATPSTEYGTPRFVASSLALRQYARHFARRSKMLLRTEELKITH